MKAHGTECKFARLLQEQCTDARWVKGLVSLVSACEERQCDECCGTGRRGESGYPLCGVCSGTAAVGAREALLRAASAVAWKCWEVSCQCEKEVVAGVVSSDPDGDRDSPEHYEACQLIRNSLRAVDVFIADPNDENADACWLCGAWGSPVWARDTFAYACGDLVLSGGSRSDLLPSAFSSALGVLGRESLVLAVISAVGEAS